MLPFILATVALACHCLSALVHMPALNTFGVSLHRPDAMNASDSSSAYLGQCCFHVLMLINTAM